ncbi:MAG: acyl-CoA reductase [Thermonemataceae bacterium]|nr:acyl-CoA reductase [Thermonemataceae bacterium]
MKNLSLAQRVAAFKNLGYYLKNIPFEEFNNLALQAKTKNNWFTSENVEKALGGIGKFLEAEALEKWVEIYPKIAHTNPKKVAVVMAGNIPAVGFQDFLSVLMAGHILLARPSSEDDILIKFIAEKLLEIEPDFQPFLYFVERINEAEAIIATGSDNTARYFEYYFAKKPHIIRKNRVSIAILNGKEDFNDLEALGADIFSYFGLGCRNIAKLYVPDNYDFTYFFKGIEQFNYIANHHKYFNNYEYNKAIYLLKPLEHLDNGFLLLSQSKEIASPVACLYYETYENNEELIQKITPFEQKIQCIVSKEAFWQKSYDFGQAQYPTLWDYADDIDLMRFLEEL